jgi:hypothetical protein
MSLRRPVFPVPPGTQAAVPDHNDRTRFMPRNRYFNAVAGSDVGLKITQVGQIAGDRPAQRPPEQPHLDRRSPAGRAVLELLVHPAHPESGVGAPGGLRARAGMPDQRLTCQVGLDDLLLAGQPVARGQHHHERHTPWVAP